MAVEDLGIGVVRGRCGAEETAEASDVGEVETESASTGASDCVCGVAGGSASGFEPESALNNIDGSSWSPKWKGETSREAKKKEGAL